MIYYRNHVVMNHKKLPFQVYSFCILNLCKQLKVENENGKIDLFRVKNIIYQLKKMLFIYEKETKNIDSITYLKYNIQLYKNYSKLLYVKKVFEDDYKEDRIINPEVGKISYELDKIIENVLYYIRKII